MLNKPYFTFTALILGIQHFSQIGRTVCHLLVLINMYIKYQCIRIFGLVWWVVFHDEVSFFVRLFNSYWSKLLTPLGPSQWKVHLLFGLQMLVGYFWHDCFHLFTGNSFFLSLFCFYSLSFCFYSLFHFVFTLSFSLSFMNSGYLSVSTSNSVKFRKLL